MIFDVAKRFAESLDIEDYVTAETLIAADCVYTCRGECYRGPSAIIQSYRGNGDTATASFDSVEYESVVKLQTPSTALVHFIDHLQHNAKRHTFECEQLIEINENHAIIRIEHIDLPGQMEALDGFNRETGNA